jgi:lipoprotein-releasing system permease protein
MKRSVNRDIALTHILSRKKQTLIAALGVTIGVALYVFSNSLMKGFSAYSRAEIFKTTPHVRIFREDEMSKPLLSSKSKGEMIVISNPGIIPKGKRINNPVKLMQDFRKFSFVKSVAPQVNVEVFYSNGQSQLKGQANGVEIAASNAMFNIESTVLTGELQSLEADKNSVFIGKGIAAKLNLDKGDHLTLTSAFGITKVLKIVGIFSTGNKTTDESKTYIDISAAQQLMKQDASFITDIYVGLHNPDSSLIYAKILQQNTGYKVEDWQTSNADLLSGDNVRDLMNGSVSFAIMLIAAFGIYNILNMTITQKLNDIAILKATGFKGKHIVRIFVLEALIMGIIGTFMGVVLGGLLIYILSKVYVGPPIGYFPIYFDLGIFLKGSFFGMIMALGAGYLPARKAAKVDPITIFRK